MKILSSSPVNYTEHMDSASSAWLVAECIAGNQAAIEALIREYEADVFRLALSILDDQADAHEVTQETFIAALRALPSYQERQSFKSWLYVIALNLSRSHLRKRKFLEKLKNATTTLFRLESQKQTSPEEAVVHSEKEAAVWNELNKLDERHRLVVILRYFQDLSITEISEILGINEGTIHSRLYTARERLRISLRSLHGE
jgi:RNA polymerase sigma-70 factor, ECF subfamily